MRKFNRDLLYVSIIAVERNLTETYMERLMLKGRKYISSTNVRDLNGGVKQQEIRI